METYIDSSQFAAGGLYRVFIRTELIETALGTIVEEAAVAFSSTIGTMQPEISGTDEFGRTFSILSVEVTGTDQNGLVINTELSEAPSVYKQTPSMVVPGVEALISPIQKQ